MPIYGYVAFFNKRIQHTSFDKNYTEKLKIFVELYAGGSCFAFDERLFYITMDENQNNYNGHNLIAIMTNIEYNVKYLISDFNHFISEENDKNSEK